MRNPAEELVLLQDLCSGAVLVKEGGKDLVYLPRYTFTAVAQRVSMDLVLYPYERDGYKTRVFYERKVEGRCNNWNLFRVIDRQLWTPSWNDVSADQPWFRILLAHLEPLK